MSGKPFYAWVRVGDGDPEPAAITGEKPNRKAVTFGCPDAFSVDNPLSGCSIVWMAAEYGNPRYDQPMEAEIEPLLEDHSWSSMKEVTRLEAAERERAYQAAIRKEPHSYAGFGRLSRDRTA